MNNLQSPRGTRDVLPADQAVWTFVRDAAERVARQLNFQRISTPTYEERELFQRSIGGGTDVIDKELFIVRGIETEPGSEQYALRPEGTAGIVRAYIEHGMQTWPQPVKLWSFVNCFRYDRPQKGRYREHTQFDLELFGDSSAWYDAWIILAMWRFYQEVGLGEHVQLKLNTLGTPEERVEYVHSLVTYLEPLQNRLSEDSKRRLQTNPLRILDSKDAGDRDVCAQAPHLNESIGTASRDHYEQVKEYLTAWSIPFVEDPYLVRGLDYYSHTTFEWVPTDSDASQASLGGGGRYDGLVRQLGGPETGAVGCGIGLDRICELIQIHNSVPALPPCDYFLVAADEAGRTYIRETLLQKLIGQGKSVDACLSREGVGPQLKLASKSGARAAVIIGEREVTSGMFQVKNLETGEQSEQAL